MYHNYSAVIISLKQICLQQNNFPNVTIFFVIVQYTIIYLLIVIPYRYKKTKLCDFLFILLENHKTVKLFQISLKY